jgi:DNA-binding NarL/FixJ family response regulator
MLPLGAAGDSPDAIRLLLVDDVPQVRRELRTALSLTGGVQVVGEAADGRQAVDLAQSLEPDVVLMDLEMTGMDGFEAGALIKAAAPSCRLVALTIHAGADERRRAIAAGFDAFVVKGASMLTLMLAIQTQGETR